MTAPERPPPPTRRPTHSLWYCIHTLVPRVCFSGCSRRWAGVRTVPRAGPACTQTVWAPHPRHVWLCFPQTCNAGCPISTALKTRLRAVSQSSLGCLEPMTEIRPPQRESLKCLGACSEGRSSDVTAHQVGLKSAFPPGPLGPEQVLFSSAVTASAGPSPPPLPPTSTATRTGLDGAGALGLGWGPARSKPSREPSGQCGVAGAGSSHLFIPAHLGALS